MRKIGHAVARPFLAVMLCGQIGMGAGLVFDGLTDNYDTTLAHFGIYDGLLTAIGAIAVIGATLSLVGMRDRSRISRSWALQATGHTMLAGVWAVYAVTLCLLSPGLLVSWGFPLSAAAASAIFLRVVLIEEKITRRTVEEMNDNDADPAR